METSCVRPDTSDFELILRSIDSGDGYCGPLNRHMPRLGLDVRPRERPVRDRLRTDRYQSAGRARGARYGEPALLPGAGAGVELHPRGRTDRYRTARTQRQDAPIGDGTRYGPAGPQHA